jgi:hypothetical protein
VSYVIPDCDGVNRRSGISWYANKFALTGMRKLPANKQDISLS